MGLSLVLWACPFSYGVVPLSLILWGCPFVPYLMGLSLVPCLMGLSLVPCLMGLFLAHLCKALVPQDMGTCVHAGTCVPA